MIRVRVIVAAVAVRESVAPPDHATPSSRTSCVQFLVSRLPKVSPLCTDHCDHTFPHDPNLSSATVFPYSKLLRLQTTPLRPQGPPV